MAMDKLYRKLRNLISDKYTIRMEDSLRNGRSKVAVVSKDTGFPWTAFEGSSIEDAFLRAINKFENPDNDYVAVDGHIWAANEESVFCANHIQLFLAVRERPNPHLTQTDVFGKESEG